MIVQASPLARNSCSARNFIPNSSIGSASAAPAPPAPGTGADGPGHAETGDRRDGGPGPGGRLLDGTGVADVAAHDLNAGSEALRRAGRVSGQDPNLGATLRQQRDQPCPEGSTS